MYSYEYTLCIHICYRGKLSSLIALHVLTIIQHTHVIFTKKQYGTFIMKNRQKANITR